MTRSEFLEYCSDTYGQSPDYPFERDFETAVLRHTDTGRWYAIVMKVSRRKFGIDSDEITDVVNLKLPLDMFGSFGACDGVYPAYHMNKLHWISVILADASEETLHLLTEASYESTRKKPTRRKQKNQA